MKVTEQTFDLTLLSNFLHQIVNPLNGVCGTLDNIAENQVPAGAVPQRVSDHRLTTETA